MAQSLARDFIQGRLDRSVATVPNARIDSRFNDKAWDAGANGAAPVTVKPGDEVTEFGTSFSQWGSWLARTDAEKIDAAKQLLRDGARAPAPVRVDGRQMDVWTQTRISPLTGDAGGNRGQAYTSYFGADYKPVHGILLGGMVQLDTAQGSSAAIGGSATGQGYMAGPYVAMQVTPHITVDAKTVWGQAQDSIAAGATSSLLETSRQLTKAQIKGAWSWNNWHLTPTATVESIEETAIGPAGQTQASVSVNRVSVGPRLSHRVNYGKGKSIEPFVHVNSSMDLDAAGAMLRGQTNEVGTYNTIGAGIALSQSDEYTLRATADVEDPGSGADKTVRGGVKLTIPLD